MPVTSNVDCGGYCGANVQYLSINGYQYMFHALIYSSLISVSNSVKDLRMVHLCAKHKLITILITGINLGLMEY